MNARRLSIKSKFGLSAIAAGIACMIGHQSALSAYGFIDKSLHKVVFPEHCYIDKAGNVVFKCPYRTESYQFSDGLVRVVAERGENPCSFFDKHGKVVIEGLSKCGQFAEGLAVAGPYGKQGFIDKTGKTIVTPIFQQAGTFREGLAPIMINEKGGFVDKSGRVAIEPFYDAVACFSEGLAAAQSDGRIGFIDKKGKWQIKPRFNSVSGFSDGLALVSSGAERSYIDRTGNIKIKLTADQSRRPIVGGRPALTDLSIHQLAGALNRFNLASWQLGDVSSFSEGRAAIFENEKFGYIDKTGELVIPAKYELAFPFANGLARVKFDGKFGYIDRSGKFVIEPKYREAADFSEDAAAVSLQKDKWGFIDTKGNVIVAPKYSYVWDFSDGLAHVQLDSYQKEPMPQSVR